MPNWCQNTLNLTNSDSTEIDKVETELKKDEKCEFLKSLRSYEGEWDYGWCVNNWGTKWDVNVYNWERMDDNTIAVSFDSAWGPPITLYEFLYENGWEVEAFYHEEGMCFAGIFSDGYNDEYEYSSMSADEIEESLPHELDEMFGISSYRREWESDQEDVDLDEEELIKSLDEIKIEVDKLDKEK